MAQENPIYAVVFSPVPFPNKSAGGDSRSRLACVIGRA